MLITLFTISVLLMILTPVLVASLVRRRFQVPWLLFAIGTLTFIGSQVVHFPLNDLLVRLHLLPESGLNDPTIPLVQTSLLLGLTAGLCEETARAVGYWLLKRYRRLEDGLMLGIGHGGVEAMIFGGVLTAATVSAYIPMLGTDLSTLNLLPEQQVYLSRQLQALVDTPLLAAAAPLLERLLAMLIHIILSIMVLQAFRRRNALYFVAAIFYHMLIDAGAVYLSTIVTNPWVILLALVGVLLPGAAWLVVLWRREAHPAPHTHPPARSELAIFAASVRKELIQQWRTRRLLVVMAVFVLFGLTSPLVAKMLPEIMKSIAGAEQFADLIPTPTAVDAMTQYIKNLTQFGFMLAILLGMNAVAGEKESGTAAMILSKPMPRWAFVLSKFSAQALVYLLAFLVAGLGAYYYTVILFGAFDPLRFLAINLLLLLWLLTFVGAALLGSVIGSSIASAAGVGFAIAAAFLLAGSIPQFGALMPNGLVAWASMLGANSGPAAANAGALAAGFVLIVLCLLWSVALFERQEI
jgi:ABC-2 type transport system permease protein